MTKVDVVASVTGKNRTLVKQEIGHQVQLTITGKIERRKSWVCL